MLIRLVRRAAVSLGVAGAIASVLRTFATGAGELPQSGGWRELTAEELR